MTKHYDSWDDVTRDFTEEQLVQAYNDAGVINWQKAQRAMLSRMFKPVSTIHGHYLHTCTGSDCTFPVKGRHPFPDLSISIERGPIGGYLAFSNPDNLEVLGEGASEEACFLEAYGHLVDGEYHPSFQCDTLLNFGFRSLNIHTMSILEEPYMRAWFSHDLDDVISAIDLPGGLLS
jgi:hypothetical protein